MEKLLIILLPIFLSSCSSKVLQQSYFAEKHFESNRGHLFEGNQIWFNNDYTFRYVGHGPSIFISMGYWKYNETKNEIELLSNNSFKPKTKNPIDTMWVDLSNKKIKVLSRKKIVLDEVEYYQR